jgi:hypothetical protein
MTATHNSIRRVRRCPLYLWGGGGGAVDIVMNGIVSFVVWLLLLHDDDNAPWGVVPVQGRRYHFDGFDPVFYYDARGNTMM